MGHKFDLQSLGQTRWELEGHRIRMRTASSFLLPIWFLSHITQSSGLAPLCTKSLDLSWVQCSHLALLVLRARCSSGVLLRPRVMHTLGTDAHPGDRSPDRWCGLVAGPPGFQLCSLSLFCQIPCDSGSAFVLLIASLFFSLQGEKYGTGICILIFKCAAF